MTTTQNDDDNDDVLANLRIAEQHRSNQSADAESSHWDLAKKHFLGFYAPNLACGIGTAMNGTLIPVSLRALKQTDSIIGLVAASTGIARALFEIPTSLLSHKLGPWVTMLSGSIILAIILSLPAIFYTTWSFFVSASITGVGLVLFATPRHECIQHAFSSSERTRVSGHMGAIGRISFMVGPPLAGVLFDHVSERAAYLTATGVCAALVVILLCSTELRELDSTIMKEEEEKAARKQQKQDALSSSSSSSSAPALLTATGVTSARYGNDPQSRPSAASAASFNGDREEPLLMQDDSTTDNDDDTLSAMETDSVVGDIDDDDHLTRSNFQIGSVPSQSMLTVTMRDASKKKSATNELDKQNDDHDDSLCALFCQHWKSVVFTAGVIVLTVMAVRQARRLAITLRALNEGMSANHIGILLMASFSVDTIFFWLCSVLVDRWGFRAGICPMLFFYAIGFAVLSLDSAGMTWTLYAALPCFGVADSMGAGIVLALLAQAVPRKLIGVCRLVGIDLGTVAGPLLTGGLSHAFGLQKMCWTMGVLSLVVSIFSFFWLGSMGMVAPKKKY